MAEKKSFDISDYLNIALRNDSRQDIAFLKKPEKTNRLGACSDCGKNLYCFREWKFESKCEDYDSRVKLHIYEISSEINNAMRMSKKEEKNFVANAMKNSLYDARVIPGLISKFISGKYCIVIVKKITEGSYQKNTIHLNLEDDTITSVIFSYIKNGDDDGYNLYLSSPILIGKNYIYLIDDTYPAKTRIYRMKRDVVVTKKVLRDIVSRLYIDEDETPEQVLRETFDIDNFWEIFLKLPHSKVAFKNTIKNIKGI